MKHGKPKIKANKSKSKRTIILFAIFLLIVFLLFLSTTQKGGYSLHLKEFRVANDVELQTLIFKKQLIETATDMLSLPIFTVGYYGKPTSIGSVERGITKSISESTYEPRYSKTTTVYAGVDEYDLIKTDGKRIYALDRESLRIYDLNVSLLERLFFSLFGKGYVKGILTDYKNKLFVVYEEGGNTYVYIFSIENLLNNITSYDVLKISGRLRDARFNGKYLVVVTQEWNKLPVVCERKCITPAVIIRDFSGNFINLLIYNVEKNRVDSFSFSDKYYTTMTFRDNIYLVFKAREKRERDEIEIIKECENLTEEEKNELIKFYEDKASRLVITNELKQKLNSCYENYLKYVQYSVIIKIDPENKEVKEGKVPGYLLNTFSIDEYKGNVRVATTISFWDYWSGRVNQGNNVYVLDKDLNIIGKVEGIEKNEEIYSVRFMGDKVLLVTFRQMDPFFVIDLSNPENPKVLGKLKIPGYSTYLHRLNETLILGIGAESGYLKISLYDVSDFQNPKEIDKLLVKGYSEFMRRFSYDVYKQLLVDKDYKLIFLPLRSYWWKCQSKEFKSVFCGGVIVISYKNDELKLINELLHRNAERTIYIGESLYTYSREPFMIKKWSYEEILG